MPSNDQFSVPIVDYKFIELLRIDGPKEANIIASALLGEAATHTRYANEFGIQLLDYKGFYMEVGYAPGPQGPLMPTLVSPILVIRRSNSGLTYKPQLFKVRGYVNQPQTLAWIDAITWEAELGDELALKLRDREKELKNKPRPIPTADGKIVVNGEELSADELINLVRDSGLKKVQE